MANNDVNDIRPTSLRHIIGQKAVVEAVQVAVDACFQDHCRFPHTMLIGPSGQGKSTIAEVIGREMAVGFTEFLGQSLRKPAELNALLLQQTDHSIVHIDECHELPKAQQTQLYRAIDRRLIDMASGGSVQSLPVADFTLLLSTTDAYGLLEPLRNRMKLSLAFCHSDLDELEHIVRTRARGLSWQVEDDLFALIAERSQDTPRKALALLESAHRYCRSKAEDVITREHLEQACRMENITSLGLGSTDQAYLRLLADGPKRLNVLASLIGVPSRTLSSVNEPFLLRKGFITKDDSSRRCLTPKGVEALAAL